MAAPSAAATRPRSSLRQVVVASLIGTTIEWYDFFLYGTAAALVFGKLFFPNSDPLTGVLQAFLTYSLGFVARPIGGLVFGHFGDRIGRKRLLMASLVLMGVASAAMGLLPTYAQIGVAAPVLLAALRFVQGFAVGGEWGGAVLMAGEFGDAKRRGTWAGWPQVGVPAGNLLAAGVMAVMAASLSEADFLAWGWRVAFLLSGLLVAVGWWVRSTLSESPQFEAAEARAAAAREPAPALQALKHRPGGIAIGAGLKFGENIAYYVLTTFSIAYLADLHFKRQIGLNAVLVGSFVEMLTLPLCSALSDRIGRRWVYAIGAAGMAVWAFVFFGLLHSGERLGGGGRDGGRSDPARGDVRAAGGVHLGVISYPLSLFGSVDRLPGHLDLRRLAGPGHRRRPAAADSFDDRDLDLRRRRLRHQRDRRAARP